MNATLERRALVLEFGPGFGTADVERLFESVGAFAPIEQVTLDFTRVRYFEDAAIATLANGLAARPDPKVFVRGLDPRHRMMLLRVLGS